MRLVLRASLAAVTLAVAACGSGFTSSNEGPGDAGSEVSTGEGGGGDSSSEAGPGDDSGSPGDAGAHDGGASDGPGPGETGPGGSWCTTHSHQFCEDFDKFSTLNQFLGAWTTFSTIGGSFAFDTKNALSVPNALAVATTSANGVRTLAIHAMSGGSSNLAKQRLEFDLFVNDASNIGALSAAAVAAIVFGNDVNSGAVAVAFGNGTGSAPTLSAVYLGPQPDSGIPAFGSANAPPPFPAFGQWDGRFAIEIDYGPVGVGDGGNVATACAQLYVGGNPQLNPCLALPPSLSHPKATSIALGVYSGGAGNTGTVGVTFDDVTYDAE